tara:strand:- start:1739 stop:2377 length:639 start_codon:yes stop_codon:yes gene_type:complete
MPICDKNKLIFIHIPKTGGTSISRMIFDLERSPNQILLRDVIKIQNYYRRSSHCTSEEVKVLYPERYEKYFKITCVRNPYDRMASEYFHLKRKSPYHPILGNVGTMSFNHFVENIQQNFQHLLDFNKSPREDYNIHFLPQVNFLKIDGKIDDFKIFRFEKFYEVEKYFSKKIHLNKNTLKNNKEYRNMYDQKSKAIISNLYREDFEFLNYEK